ncbi:MAG: ArsR/SmtB family transcription factor [Acidimicrobiales bacterium]
MIDTNGVARDDVISEICRALAHPVRRSLLTALATSECDVGRLSSHAGVDQPTASKHLAALRHAGLVRVRVDGRRRCYSLADEEIVTTLLALLVTLERARASDGSSRPAQ